MITLRSQKDQFASPYDDKKQKNGTDGTGGGLRCPDKNLRDHSKLDRWYRWYRGSCFSIGALCHTQKDHTLRSLIRRNFLGARKEQGIGVPRKTCVKKQLPLYHLYHLSKPLESLMIGRYSANPPLYHLYHRFFAISLTY